MTSNIFGGDLLLETGTNEIQLVEFILKGQSFGCNVDKIQQIIEKPTITPIPEMSSWVTGVFEFRGQTVPLLDLRNCLKFNSQSEKDTPITQKVVVMDFNRVINGFLVDDVKRLHRLSWSEIEPPTLLVKAGEDPFAVGMIRFEDRICTLIDFEKIIATINPEVAIQHNPEIVFEESRKDIHILFAEDSPFVRHDVHQILTKAGYSVIAVENGFEAIKVLNKFEKECEKGNFPINKFLNIVLTDIEMPKMDGRHLTKQIKESPILKELPVFLFTSMSGMWGEIKAKSIGAEGLFSKPEIQKVAKDLDKLALPPYTPQP